MDWPLIRLQPQLIEISTRVVRHIDAIIFQFAEVAVTGSVE